MCGLGGTGGGGSDVGGLIPGELPSTPISATDGFSSNTSRSMSICSMEPRNLLLDCDGAFSTKMVNQRIINSKLKRYTEKMADDSGKCQIFMKNEQ